MTGIISESTDDYPMPPSEPCTGYATRRTPSASQIRFTVSKHGALSGLVDLERLIHESVRPELVEGSWLLRFDRLGTIGVAFILCRINMSSLMNTRDIRWGCCVFGHLRRCSTCEWNKHSLRFAVFKPATQKTPALQPRPGCAASAAGFARYGGHRVCRSGAGRRSSARRDRLRRVSGARHPA